VLACLYDVHGNLPALEAVLADARAQGAERHLLGGDYALYGGWPAETLARLREIEGAIWIRGNVDRWLTDPGDVPAPVVHGALEDCRAALGEEAVAWLHALPERATLDDGTMAVHATPISDMRFFAQTVSTDDEELLGGIRPPRLLFGHTHVAFRRVALGVELVNPGSVGLPWDGDHRAAYALVHPDGRLEHRRVAYDHAASVQQLREAYGDAPWVRSTAARLEQARFDAA
jgi:predicted phosphodiesterase